MRVLDDFVHEMVTKIGRDRAFVVEERIRLLLRPKPRWAPKWAWEAVLRRVLVIETTHGQPREIKQGDQP